VRGGGIEVGGQLGDLITEALQLGGVRRRGQHGRHVSRHWRVLPLLERLYTPIFDASERAQDERSDDRDDF
jgi:hypothetical protein